jgi:hypothetical protein
VSNPSGLVALENGLIGANKFTIPDFEIVSVRSPEIKLAGPKLQMEALP